ncbi:MAG: hypothetical protein ABIL40_09145, partial [candidate division WOR-3 bacterium]
MVKSLEWRLFNLLRDKIVILLGTQAVLNVLSGRRWHIVPDEMKQYLRGRYGAAPGPISPEVLQRVLGDEQPISGRPAD